MAGGGIYARSSGFARGENDEQKKLPAGVGRNITRDTADRNETDVIPPLLLRAVQQLRARIPVRLFPFNPVFLQPQYYRGGRVRKAELKRLVREKPFPGAIEFADADYEDKLFFEKTKGLEREPECGRRCFVCYEMRLRKTAQMAVEAGAAYFCTTLSISPHKNADKLMEIGEALADEYGISYLPSDFKKKNGYKRSIELSREYDLYRQNYCGCIYSRKAAERDNGWEAGR